MSLFEDPAKSGSLSTVLDSRAVPPKDLTALFKRYQLMKCNQLAQNSEISDFSFICIDGLDSIPETRLIGVFERFLLERRMRNLDEDIPDYLRRTSVYSSQEIPGLMILPSLFPPIIQDELLSKLLHRDLSNPDHQTNLHMHYNISYPDSGNSFFSGAPSTVLLEPKNVEVHKPLSIKQVLEKKLRWITLGGQYDWTNKVYPDETPPAFPRDLANLIGGLFPDMEAQAAIVNLYSPGDTLSLHRDVSEEVDRGLVSVSLGCDCLFVIGLGEEGSQVPSQQLVLRLRSGDAVYMSGQARYAWHGVPKVIPGTCPEYLAKWPGGSFEEWQGYMTNKRINLNVRQMRESTATSKVK